MNKKTITVALLSLLLMLLLTSTAAAQTSTNIDLSWFNFPGGAGQSTSTNLALNSTLGQWTVGLVESASYGINSSYWQPWLDQTICLPLILR